MAKKKQKNYLETFVFPGIDVAYPVYALNEEGKVVNFKSVIYPNPRSKKKFTRGKQLSKRSLQAKMFDTIINIGYFDPLTVYIEFPVVIQNSLRIKGQSGMYILLDYYFPELKLAVELDSELHDKTRDELRDKYLSQLGITVWRMSNFHKSQVQKKEFRELTRWMREQKPGKPIEFDFLKDIRVWAKNASQGA